MLPHILQVGQLPFYLAHATQSVVCRTLNIRFCANLHCSLICAHANDAARKTAASVAGGLTCLALGADFARVTLAEVVLLNAQRHNS